MARHQQHRLPARDALVVLAVDGAVREVLVDLSATRSGSLRTIEGAGAPITPEDYAAAAAGVLADERVQVTLRLRGVRDLALVQVDVLPRRRLRASAGVQASDSQSSRVPPPRSLRQRLRPAEISST